MICISRQTSVLALVCLLLMLVISGPLAAQEDTPTPHPITTEEATREATPIATHEAAAPVSVDSGGGSVTINTGSASPAPQTPQSGLLTLTVGEVTAIVLGTLALMGVIGKALWDGNQSGVTLDARVTSGIEAAQQNQNYMEALERAYANGNASLKKALDSTVSVLQIIAPLTGIKLDDAALELLKNIQNPAPLHDGSPREAKTVIDPSSNPAG